MKIGITCYPTYGGSGVVATELGKELANRGHDVHFISYALPIRLTMKDRVYFHEVEVLTYPLFEYPPYDLVLATKMAEVMIDAAHQPWVGGHKNEHMATGIEERISVPQFLFVIFDMFEHVYIKDRVRPGPGGMFRACLFERALPGYCNPTLIFPAELFDQEGIHVGGRLKQGQ